ncbi:AAA family ATPase [Dichotomicrobium thermohalophilum]|uniref:AAA domain-containing protein n=1 Tax=Dichotomicrobium thermohalophilum TaxID=933063 RepID=A0A397QCR9_9HYPH|nr:AAA family ATPase [Dichotomicrobium thermohalophilum]RIA56051.1 AAA domain-containing protein [Dichotomicrobium thermohalophilum]
MKNYHAAGSVPNAKTLTQSLGGTWHDDSGYGTACCPAHDDKKPSLSISPGDMRRVVVHCHAGCGQEAVIGALRERGLWPQESGAIYDYRDASGTLGFQVVRRSGKNFRQRQPDGKGGWIWNAKGAPLLIYRLPEVREAITAGRTIFVTEGEKDADRLAGFGLTATCNPGGAGKWRAEYSAHLHGTHVVILPDNDDPGRKHAHQVAASLQGWAKSVRVLNLPSLREKGDVSDWLDAGGTVDELERLAASTSEWSPPPETDEAPHTIPLIPFRELAPETRRRDLIRGLFPLEGLSVAWGEPKCGKSFLILDALLHVALGWEYHGRRVAQGAVVYCAFEGQRGVRARVEAFRRHHRLDDANPPFYLMPATLDLIGDHNALIDAIGAQIGDTPPVAVCLDTLNRSLRGSENKDEDMSAYIAACDAIREAFDCAVIVVHHCGVEGTRPRGHTSLTGAADAQLAVKRAADGRITATVEYVKDFEAGEQIACELEEVDVGIDEDGETITSCVVVPADVPLKDASAKDGPKLTKNQQTMLDILREAGPDGLTTRAWNDRARGAGLGVNRRAHLAELRKALEDKGWVIEGDTGWVVQG